MEFIRTRRETEVGYSKMSMFILFFGEGSRGGKMCKKRSSSWNNVEIIFINDRRGQPSFTMVFACCMKKFSNVDDNNNDDN